MADPQKYYRLQSLANRGFYVPDVIPFEEIATNNQLMLFKNQNAQQSSAMNLPRKRKPGQKMQRGPGRPQSLAFQELVPEEAAGAPGNYMNEIQQDNLTRKGIR